MTSNAHNLSQLAMSPMKSAGGVINLPNTDSRVHNQQIQQVARQSKNSSALGMIGGSIVTNQGPGNGNGAQSQNLERSGGSQVEGQNNQHNPFNRQANS